MLLSSNHSVLRKVPEVMYIFFCNFLEYRYRGSKVCYVFGTHVFDFIFSCKLGDKILSMFPSAEMIMGLSGLGFCPCSILTNFERSICPYDP